MKATCSSIRRSNGGSGGSDKYVESETLSEGPRLALHDPVRELVDVFELLVDQGLRVLLDRPDGRPLLRDDLRGSSLRLVNRLSDLRHDADPDLLHLARVLLHEPVGDVEGKEVVQLADVGYRVLPCRGFHGHRSVWGDEATDPIAATDAAIVPVLPRQAGDGEVEDAGLIIVPGV